MARLTFPDVKFSHVVAAEYKAGANLKTTIENTSKVTFLKGPVALTLDGRFLGRTVLPHCSAGCVFSLDLGIDPAIKIIYCKPEARRVTNDIAEMFDISMCLYTRALTMQNTGTLAVPIMVRDQIPVSEDDSVLVRVLSYSAIKIDSQGVAISRSERGAPQEKDWDEATATFHENGEVNWHVALDAGKAVRLFLEYSVSFPKEEDVA